VYFQVRKESILYDIVHNYFQKYNSLPPLETIKMTVTETGGITQVEQEDILEYVNELKVDTFDLTLEVDSDDWLTDQTETFCSERAIHNAILTSVDILDGENKQLDKGAIPKLLSDALAVSFDTHIGHDYVNDSEDRFEYYHRIEKKIPFDMDSFNKITRGGFSTKTLNILLAGTGVGKSLAMCSFAASNLSMGFKVLYITLEMSEERIAERIDANLLQTNIGDLESLLKTSYDRKIERMKESVKGQLMIKEYPTASANVTHFRSLIDELKMKKNFVPDIIYVDYLNIASSSRVRMGNSINSYTYVKSIAEELRGLAVEYNIPVMTATQTNRTGFVNSDVDLGDTSESFGLPMTADMMFAIMTSDEMQENGQFMVKQLKNRYVDPTFMKRFLVGVDYAQMRLYELQGEKKIEQSDETFTDMKRKRKPIGNGFVFGEKDESKEI
jgi:hypothetical protein